MDVLNVLGGMYWLPWMYSECDGDVAMDVYCTPCTNVYLAQILRTNLLHDTQWKWNGHIQHCNEV